MSILRTYMQVFRYKKLEFRGKREQRNRTVGQAQRKWCYIGLSRTATLAKVKCT